MERLDMLSHDILVAEHLAAIRTRIRAHNAVMRQHVLLPRVPVGEGLRANLTDVILGRGKVEALLMALERLDRGEDLLAVWTGVAQTLVNNQNMIPQLTFGLQNKRKRQLHFS
jgi:hypothetical protein